MLLLLWILGVLIPCLHAVGVLLGGSIVLRLRVLPVVRIVLLLVLLILLLVLLLCLRLCLAIDAWRCSTCTIPRLVCCWCAADCCWLLWLAVVCRHCCCWSACCGWHCCCLWCSLLLLLP